MRRNTIGEWQRLEDNRYFQAKVAERDTTINQIVRSIAHERFKRATDSVTAKVRLDNLGKINNSLTKTIAKLRPDIQPYLDSIKAVGEFVALQDSALEVRDVTIAVLETTLDTARQSYNREIKDWERKSAEQEGKITLWQGEATKNAALYFKADKRSRRRFSFGPYIGYGMSQGGLSPSVGVGVSYQLIRW